MNTTDSSVWKGNASGVITARSFYKYLMHGESSMVGVSWSWVWKLWCSQKNRFFVWLVLHGRLVTNEYRVRIGIGSEDMCPSCSAHSETIQHMLRDCTNTRQIWHSLLPPDAIRNFFNQPFLPWLRYHATATDGLASFGHTLGDLPF